MIVASDWLALVFTLSLFAWFANRRAIALSLPFAAALAALAVYVPLGKPIPHAPKPGRYTVVGAKIEVDKAIWVLLDDGDGEPIYYVLPYSAGQANALQAAEDAGQGQPGSVKMEVGQDGGTRYDGEPPVSGSEPPKVPEQPAVTIP